MGQSIDLTRCPKIKPTVQRNDMGGKVYLRTAGRVTEIDLSTIYGLLIEAMDGIKSVHALIEHSKTEGYLPEDVINALHEFDQLLLIEDGVETANGDQSTLSQGDQERFARNLNFFGSYTPLGQDKFEPQEKIRDCKVTILGLGGLGSHLLYDLAALGCKDILAVEFDNVELSNLNRQILYTPADVGGNKAEAARRRILEFSPDLKFQVYNEKISSAKDVVNAIKGRDLAICVADRPKTEILWWVNEACVAEKVPLMTGGLDTKIARYYCTLPDQGCLECWRHELAVLDPKADELLLEQRRTQLRGDNAAFVPFVALLAGFLTADFVKIVTGIGGKPVGLNNTKEIAFDTMHAVTGETWSRNPTCPCCGDRMHENEHSSVYAEA